MINIDKTTRQFSISDEDGIAKLPRDKIFI